LKEEKKGRASWLAINFLFECFFSNNLFFSHFGQATRGDRPRDYRERMGGEGGCLFIQADKEMKECCYRK